MARFSYLEAGSEKTDKKAVKKAKKLEKAASKKSDRRRKQHEEDHGPVEVVYVRRETIRAAWRELKADGGDNLSELVDDLLLAWLSERQTESGVDEDDEEDEDDE